MSSTAPAYTIGGITRPELFFDANGNIVLTPAAEQFAATYGIKALYLGLPANTPYLPSPTRCLRRRIPMRPPTASRKVPR
jgi:hypothetical protein